MFYILLLGPGELKEYWDSVKGMHMGYNSD